MKLLGALTFVILTACTNGKITVTNFNNCTNCSGGGSGPTINFVQETPKSESTAAASLTMNFASQPVIGNLVVVYICQYGVNVSSVIDTYGNSYSQAKFENNASWFSYIYYSVVSSTGAGFNVTVNLTAGGGQSVAATAEFSGLVTSSPLDQTANSSANLSSTASSGTTAMTSQPNELIVANLDDTNGNGALNYTAQWTPVFTETNGLTYTACQGIYQIVNVQAAYSETWTTPANASNASVIATFKGL